MDGSACSRRQNSEGETRVRAFDKQGHPLPPLGPRRIIPSRPVPHFNEPRCGTGTVLDHYTSALALFTNLI